MKRFRVGVMGAGWVAGARHVPSLRSHPDVDLVAVFDRRQARADAMSATANIPLATTDLNRFFDAGLDVVTICTPPWDHAALAEQAVLAGAHVFCEKPMAMDLLEAQRMVDVAKTHDRLLCISHNFLFSRALQQAERWLEGDRISYVMGLQMSSPARRLPTWYQDLPAGLLFDESPHMLYTLQHFLGGPLTLDHVRATPNETTGHPATAEVALRGSRGVGQLTMLFETPMSEWHVTLVGKGTTVALDLFRDIAVPIGADGAHKAADIARTSARAILGHARGFAAAGSRLVRGRQYWGHDTLIHAFVDAVAGRRPVPVEPSSSLGIVALTDKLLAALGSMSRPAPLAVAS